MTNQQFYSLSQLRNTWCNKNYESDETHQKLLLFLEEPDFFFDRFETPFYIGNDGKHVYLMFDGKIYQEIRSQLEELLKVKLEDITPLRLVEVIEICQYTNRKEYYTILKRITKYDKNFRLKLDHNNLRLSLSTAKQLLMDKQYYFICFDVENYEDDHSCILEVGLSVFDSRNKKFADLHVLIKDHYQLRNYKYVPDRKDNFNFGESIWIKLVELPILMQTIINKYTPLIIVGHSIDSDIKYMEKIGVRFNNVHTVYDTAMLHKAYLDDMRMQCLSLGKALDLFNIPNKYLHNAGNDAHFTLELFLKLIGIENTYLTHNKTDHE